MKELKGAGYSPKMACLGAKRHYCIHSDVKDADSVDWACDQKKESADGRGCKYYNEYPKVMNSAHQTLKVCSGQFRVAYVPCTLEHAASPKFQWRPDLGPRQHHRIIITVVSSPCGLRTFVGILSCPTCSYLDPTCCEQFNLYDAQVYSRAAGFSKMRETEHRWQHIEHILLTCSRVTSPSPPVEMAAAILAGDLLAATVDDVSVRRVVDQACPSIGRPRGRCSECLLRPSFA